MQGGLRNETASVEWRSMKLLFTNDVDGCIYATEAIGMTQTLVHFFIFALVLACPAKAAFDPDWVQEFMKLLHKNEASTCLSCTVGFGLIQQRSLQVHENCETILKNLCADLSHFDSRAVCDVAEALGWSAGLRKLNPLVRPEENCVLHGLCPLDYTLLFPTWPPTAAAPDLKPLTPRQKFIWSDSDYWTDLMELVEFIVSGYKKNIQQVVDTHLPMKEDDKDADKFSHNPTLRGYSWRGRDCRDDLPNVFPGRLVTNYSADVDHNCNGIFGVDENGVSYEEKFCSKTPGMGVIIIGDSAAAHFRIPPALMNATTAFDAQSWDGFLQFAENEGDWPQCSWATAWEDGLNCPPSALGDGIYSIYSMMKQRNRCNHRDYQNIGINGADSFNENPLNSSAYIFSMERDQKLDQPALVFFALIGNDVCTSHPGTSYMTTVEQFKSNVLAALKYLDSKLPSGSHVVFVPLAPGTYLYSILHDQIHPIGVQYSQIYEYLIAEHKTPCYGWMNTNDTLRELTQQRADALSRVYPDIVANYKWDNFDTAHVPLTFWTDIFDAWSAAGGDPRRLIEPVDGFHPSTATQMLAAKSIWKWLETEHPSFIGEVNPFNEQIHAIFGDQGGY